MSWVTVGVAAFSVGTSLKQAEGIRENSRFTKAIADINAQYAELDAYNAIKNGYTKEARYQSVVDATLGEQKTALAAKDVDINFGTAKDLQSESKLNGFLNRLDIKNQANETALGYMNQARNIRLGGQAAADQGDMNAQAISTAGVLNAASVGISGYSRRKGS